jgi:hypothetical protein
MSLLIAVCSCSKPAGQGADYLPPLSNGASWHYNIEYMAFGVGVQNGKAVDRIDGTESLGGKTYFKEVVVYSGIPGAEPEITYHRQGPEGVFSIDGKHKDRGEYLEFPFPLNVGKAWTVTSPARTLDYKVESIETLELIDRKYEDCLKLSFVANDGQRGTIWLAKGIGAVKVTITSSGVAMDFLLEKYER